MNKRLFSLMLVLALMLGLGSVVMAAATVDSVKLVDGAKVKDLPTDGIDIVLTGTGSDKAVKVKVKTLFSAGGATDTVPLTVPSSSPIVTGITSTPAAAGTVAYASAGTETEFTFSAEAAFFAAGVAPKTTVTYEIGGKPVKFNIIDGVPKFVNLTKNETTDKAIVYDNSGTYPALKGYFVYGLKTGTTKPEKPLATASITVTDSSTTTGKAGFYAGVDASKIKVVTPANEDKLNSKVAAVKYDKNTKKINITFKGLGSTILYMGPSADNFGLMRINSVLPDTATAVLKWGEKSAPTANTLALGSAKSVAVTSGNSYLFTPIYTNDSVVEDTEFLMGKGKTDGGSWIVPQPLSTFSVSSVGAVKVTSKLAASPTATFVDAFGNSTVVTFNVTAGTKDKGIASTAMKIGDKSTSTGVTLSDPGVGETVYGMVISDANVGKGTIIEVTSKVAGKDKKAKVFWFSADPSKVVVTQKGEVTVPAALPSTGVEIGFIVLDTKGLDSRTNPITKIKVTTSTQGSGEPQQSGANDITATSIGTLSGTSISVPSTTKVSALKDALTVSAKATVEILDGSEGDPVENQTNTNVLATMVIEVTAENGDTKEYTIALQSDAKAITAFSFAALEPTVNGTITEASKSIAVTVPNGTTVTGLVATFTLSDGASAKVGSVAQESGTTANDFTSPVVYIVTAEDGTTESYTVTVTVSAS